MKKAIKYIGVVVGVLAVFIVSLSLYPEFSAIRRGCSQIRVGMLRDQVESIMGDLLEKDLDMLVVDGNHIYTMNNGVDCSIDFDEQNTVTSVTSAVDSF